MIFANEDLEPTIVLDYVVLHKHIEEPEGTTMRCGGGYWIIYKNTLVLTGESFDFGKYDMKMAREAFEAGRVTIDGETTMAELGLTELITE